MKKVLSLILILMVLILPLSLSFAYAEEDYANKFFDCKNILNRPDDEIYKLWVSINDGVEDRDAFNAQVEAEAKEELGYGKEDLPEFPSGPADAQKEDDFYHTCQKIRGIMLKDHYENIIASFNIDDSSILQRHLDYDGYGYILVEESVGKFKEIAQLDDVFRFAIYTPAYVDPDAETTPSEEGTTQAPTNAQPASNNPTPQPTNAQPNKTVPNPPTGVEGIAVAFITAITACGVLLVTSKKK